MISPDAGEWESGQNFGVRHTGITHLDGSKTLVLGRQVVSGVNVAMVAYPELTDEQVKEIMESNIERVQQLLAKHF